MVMDFGPQCILTTFNRSCLKLHREKAWERARKRERARGRDCLAGLLVSEFENVDFWKL